MVQRVLDLTSITGQSLVFELIGLLYYPLRARLTESASTGKIDFHKFMGLYWIWLLRASQRLHHAHKVLMADQECGSHWRPPRAFPDFLDKGVERDSTNNSYRKCLASHFVRNRHSNKPPFNLISRTTGRCLMASISKDLSAILFPELKTIASFSSLIGHVFLFSCQSVAQLQLLSFDELNSSRALPVPGRVSFSRPSSFT